MGRITLQQAAQWCGGKIDPKYKDITFLGANNDTRKLEKDQLFIALQGARDGHDFIPTALEKGAAAVLCTHCDGDFPAIVVEDTRIALGDIARNERQRLGMKVVAVTGSVGKSTTKEMIATVLSSTYRVGKTPVNHNNDIGMPMSILSMPEDTQIAVLEMGMNHFGEIAYLSKIARPDVAVIINIGRMHIQNLGSVEGILQAKLEILEGLSPDGKVLLNGDDSRLWDRRTELANVTYFGQKNTQSEILAYDAAQTEDRLTFMVRSEQGEFPVRLPLEGDHYICDALAAVGVGLAFSVEPEKITQSLAGFENMEGRQEIFPQDGYTIIKDCYNAGPESMAAALEVLSKKSGRRIAVLGEMLELGPCAPAEHYKVGTVAAKKADILLTYGANSQKTVEGAVTEGMPEVCTGAFEDREKLVAELKRLAKPGDVLLFKGSRGMRMELILEAFLQKETKSEEG